MSQGVIKPMIGTNVDCLAETKQVYFRPTADDTVRVGDLVCYNWDLTTDYKERGTTPITGGTAYAEGSQNYTGRLFVVEKPATANLQFFAGVVAALGDKAGADGDLIEIYVPNGAVVPVMSDQYCLNGRTIVAVRNGVYEGSYPSSAARPIGIAMETKDRSTDDGLVWTKVDPNMFAWQYHSSALNVDDEALTNDVIINKLHYTTAQTGGRFTAFEIKATVAGTPACTGYGITVYTQTDISGIMTGQNAGISHWTNFNAGGDIGGQYFAMEIGIYAGDDVDLTGIDSGEVITPLCLRTQLDTASDPPDAGTHWMMYLRADGSDTPDGLFYAKDLASIGAYASVTNAPALATGDIMIPVRILNSTYYIVALQDTGL